MLPLLQQAAIMPEQQPHVLQWEDPEPLPPIPDTNFAAFMLEEMSVYGDAVALVSLLIYLGSTLTINISINMR